MKKSFILLAVFALTANTASVVFATEGAEVPGVVVVAPEATPEVNETVLAPEGTEAEVVAAVSEVETVETMEVEVDASLGDEANEIEAESAEELTSPKVEAATAVEPEEVVSENSTVGYSEELLTEFGAKEGLVINEIRGGHHKYTQESLAKARELREEATNKVNTPWEAGNLTDAIIREGIQLLDLALASLVLETPKPENPGQGETPEAPKPEQPAPETPKPEQPAPETPKPGEIPEAPKSTLPNTGNAEATAKLKSMTMEKPVSTTSATQSDNKQLPQTGEADSFAIFSAATLTILAGVGMLAHGKREEV